MSTKPNQKLMLQNLAKQLNLTEAELLIAIKQMGLNPSEIEESWATAIAQHIKGIKPQQLDSKPEPESFSIEDSDFVDWNDVVEELGGGAIALVEELGLSPDAISRSDLAALKELALVNPVAQDMINHISTVGGLSGGLIDEYLRQQRDNAQALADAGNYEFAKTLLQGQIEGINQVVGLQNLLSNDFKALIENRIEALGKREENRPNELIKDLGKKATVAQKSSQKSTKVRHSKMDLVELKSKASKQK